MWLSSCVNKEALTVVMYPEISPWLLKHHQQTSSDNFLHEEVLSTAGVQTWETKPNCVWEGAVLFLLSNKPNLSHSSLAGLTLQC